MQIWVDDVRLPPKGAFWAMTSSEAIHWLEDALDSDSRVEFMSLDHDLGGEDTSRAIVLWMCENDFWPEKVVVHSMNPTGREWLEGMVERYHPNTRGKYERR